MTPCGRGDPGGPDGHERVPVVGHVGLQPVEQLGVARLGVDLLLLPELPLVLLEPVDGRAGAALVGALDAPHDVGQLVAEEDDVLGGRRLRDLGRRRRQQEQALHALRVQRGRRSRTSGTRHSGGADRLTSVGTPKESVTLKESIAVTEPTGRSTGTTNQSLPKVSANSASSIRASSVRPVSRPPKRTVASSISQKRSAGMPPYETGAGRVVRTRLVGATGLAGAPSDGCPAAVKSCQSSRPPRYSSEVSTTRPPGRSAWTAKECSSRFGRHALGDVGAGSLTAVAHARRKSLAAAMTFGRAAAGIGGFAGSEVSFAAVLRWASRSAASRRASGTRPTARRRRRTVSGSSPGRSFSRSA